MANTHSLDLESSSSQYASITDASQTGLDLTGDFTLEVWIKIESLPASGQVYAILGKFSDQSDQRAYRLDVNSGGDIGVIVTDDGTWTDGHRLWRVGDTNLVAGQWYHVAVSFSISTEAFVFYINGISVGAGTLTTGTTIGTTLHNSTAPFDIGADRDSSGSAIHLFDGLINNARVYNDVRTAQEIKDNMFLVPTPGVDNCVDVWKLNNSYASESGNNDLTASGSPVFSTDVPFPTYTALNPVALGSTTLGSDANLVAYYKLEDTTDEQGSFNLTNNGTTPFNAAKFNNGADQGTSNTTKYLSIANNLGIDGGAISIGGWVNLNAKKNASFFSLRSDNTDVRYFLSFNSTTTISFGREKINTAFQAVDYGGGALETGTWYHLVLTYDATTVKAYLNGILVGSVAASGNGTGTNSNLFLIGSYDGGTKQEAMYDDVAIFNRALTPSEVFELYTGLNLASNIKSFIGIDRANIKSVSGVALDNIGSINGIE